MRSTRRHFRKLFVHELEDRTTPAVSITHSAGVITITGDGGSDGISLDSSLAGMPPMICFRPSIAPGDVFDCDTTQPGQQLVLLSSITKLNIDLGGGSDIVTFFQSMAFPTITIANAETIRAVYSQAGDPDNFDATLNDTAINFTDVPVNYSWSLLTVPTVVRVFGRTGDNTLDASAVMNYNVEIGGGDGNDIIRGGALTDLVFGGNGDDVVEGGGGNDTKSFNATLGTTAGIYGEAGNDTLRGGDGNDDLIDVGPNGAAEGGPGTDFYFATGVPGALITDSSFAAGSGVSVGNAIEAFRIDGDDNANVFDAAGYTLGPVAFIGLGGNDTLRGGSKGDLLYGGNGDDLIEGNGGDDARNFNTLFGFTSGLLGEAGNDTLRGGSGRDHLDGGTDNDLLEGGLGNDSGTVGSDFCGLFGGTGIDTLSGGDGDDYLEDIGPTGVADGGIGTDQYVATLAAGAMISDVAFSMGGATSIGGAIESFNIQGDDNANVMDAGTYTLGPVWFRGLLGNDTLTGGSKADRLEGGDGDDTLDGRGGDENNTGIQVFGFQGAAILGGTGSDILRGGDGDDYLEDVGGPNGAANGGNGTDTYFGSGFNAVNITTADFKAGSFASIGNAIEFFRIQGTSGPDVFDASGLTTASVWFEGLDGNDTLRGGSKIDRLEGGNNDDLLEGGGGDDSNFFALPLNGNTAGIYGGAGNDTLRGGDGDDYLDDRGGPNAAANGGAGNDRYFGQDFNAVSIDNANFTAGSATSDGNAIEFFHIQGTSGADSFNASGLTNGVSVWFQGLAGNDTLRGGSGIDRLEGGDNDDLLEGFGGDDTNTIGMPLNGNGGGLYGEAGNDTLRGGDGNDYLDDRGGPNGAANGGAGIDVFFGQGFSSVNIDNTTFTLGTTSDGNSLEFIQVQGTAGADTMSALNLTAFSVYFQGLDGNDTLTGGGGVDRLEGGNDNDLLDGGGGNDSNFLAMPNNGNAGGIYGEAGIDTLRGGDGDDYLQDTGTGGAANGGPGNDRYYANSVSTATITETSFTFGTGATSDGNAIEGLQLDGTPGADSFDGSAAITTAFVFRGFDGNDTLRGGGNTDHLEGNDGDDTLHGGGGNDLNTLTVPLTGKAGGLYGGDKNDILDGGEGNDYLAGDAGIDDLTGGGGNDLQFGGTGNDTLRDGPETNTLVGDADTDAVIITGTTGADLILVANGSVTINGQVTAYTLSESLNVDAEAGVDEGTEVNLNSLPYTVSKLEPTVFAGPDVANTDVPFVFVRQGTFKDIGAGQSWTGMVNYAEGGGFVPLAVNSVNKTFALNHAYSSGGVFNIVVRITDDQGNTGEDTFQLIRPAGIQVGVAGGAQRSMIDQISVTFAEAVTLNAGWYTFERLSPGPTPNVAVQIVQTSPTIARLTFSGPGLDTGGPSLADGDWKLTLNSAFIINGMGQPFDGDGSGAPGGDFLFPFHRLFGDLNGDRTVEGSTDFAGFGASFGLSTGQPGFTAAFDFNGDGTVEGSTDFAQFGQRFGRTI